LSLGSGPGGQVQVWPQCSLRGLLPNPKATSGLNCSPPVRESGDFLSWGDRLILRSKLSHRPCSGLKVSNGLITPPRGAAVNPGLEYPLLQPVLTTLHTGWKLASTVGRPEIPAGAGLQAVGKHHPPQHLRARGFTNWGLQRLQPPLKIPEYTI